MFHCRKGQAFHSILYNVYMCALWVNYRKTLFQQFKVAYNNSYRILNRLPMRCSASNMFANGNVNSCACVLRKSIYSLMTRIVMRQKIRIKRGVRQGDTISPKLFTATLDSIFRRLNWEHKGVKIDGEFLSNLRFADDIFLCTETPQELQQMLQELSDESRRMGLKMNIAKTKVMVVDNTPININNVLIENVQGYVYLGQHYSLKEKNQDKEIQRRIMAGWAAYAKHRDIFKSNLAICLKRQVYNSCVLPAMTYGAETWTLTKQAQNKLAAAQTKMERSMLNITYKDRKTNIWVRERTKVIDIINTVRKMKWSWAGHINRLKDDRWTSRVTSWRPYDKKRRQGRPAKRWRDDLDKYWSDTIWQRKAQDRVVWRQHAA